jgi:hypothetical protein
MIDFSSPHTLSEYYDPIRNEQSREQSGLNALNAVQMKDTIQSNQQQQAGLAMLYKNLAPQKDEAGKPQKSKFMDDSGAIDWGLFLGSPEGSEWAQRYPSVAAVLQEKAAYGQWKVKVKKAGATPEKQWEDNKTNELLAKNPAMSPEKARATAIEEWNKQVRPMAQTATFEQKEHFNLNQLRGAFENPQGSYKKGDREGRYSTAGIMSFAESLAKGQTIDEFANSQSSSRGVSGTEGKNYLKKAYADYLSATVKDKDGKPMNPAKIGAYLSSRGNAFKANLQTQKKATEFSTLNNRAVAQMDNMATILDNQISALTQSGTKPQAMLNAWGKKAWNDPKYGSFLVALNSYLSEYMKVVSGGALSVQAITDSARTKGNELLSGSDSQESLKAKLDVMHQEVEKVKDTWTDAVATTYGAGAMTDIATSPPTAAPEKGAPAAGGVSVEDFNKMK